MQDSEQRWFETMRSLRNANVPYFLRTISEKHIRRPALSNDVRTFEMVINYQLRWMTRLLLTFLHYEMKVIKLPFLDSICIIDFLPSLLQLLCFVLLCFDLFLCGRTSLQRLCVTMVNR